MATGDLHKKLHEAQSSSSRDMLVDRQTHTDRHIHTDRVITILCTPTRVK